MTDARLTHPPVGGWVNRWLSAERFAVYVRACSGDRSRALALYLWNADMSAAFLGDLGHVEVALRNAYDRVLRDWKAPSGGHWLLDPVSPATRPFVLRGVDINERSRIQVAEAIRRAGGHRVAVGKIIAELPFGFWCHMTDARREKLLWVPHIHRVYPRHTSRSAMNRLMADLNLIRNRAAHQENLLTFDLAAQYRKLLQLAALLSVELGQLLKAGSSVLALIGSRPS